MTKIDWKQWKEEHNGNYGDLIDFAHDNGIYDPVDELISSDELDERVKAEAENGWQRVACFLETAVQYMNEDYYKISAYGNVELPESWDYYADEVESQLDFDEYICDVCGEDTDTLYSIEEWIEEEEEGNLSDELLELIRKADDNYDRCPKCWEKLKELAAYYMRFKNEIDMGWLEYLKKKESEHY